MAAIELALDEINRNSERNTVGQYIDTQHGMKHELKGGTKENVV